MTIAWKSASRSGPINVCQGDLISFRLSAVASVPSERPVDGYPPHLVYIPEFGQNSTAALGGSAQTAATEFHLDLAPFWVPYNGQVLLAGGVGYEYKVSFMRARCQPRPVDDLTITLRELTTTPIPIPYGVYAISLPADTNLTIAQAGDSLQMIFAAGQRIALGHLALGTIAATSGTVKVVHCHVRI